MAHHVLMVCSPAQGHINPALELAKRLVKKDLRVTFATTAHGLSRIHQAIDIVSFASYSDGFDQGFDNSIAFADYVSQFKRLGSETLAALIRNLASQGCPVTFIIYNSVVPWSADVADELGIPSALHWIQSATVFVIYWNHFRGSKSSSYLISTTNVRVTGMPLLNIEDLPSFLQPSNTNNIAVESLVELFEMLDSRRIDWVIASTFDALEKDLISAMEKENMTLLSIGPLVPSAFIDGKNPEDTTFGGDMWENSKDYMEWLGSKPVGSVVYVSFGSLRVLSPMQARNIARALSESRHSYLWVVGSSEKALQNIEIEDSERGLVVGWCNQVELLAHPSIGCFVMHGGWNSTIESLVAGVPMVVLPEWSDQTTNAWLVERVWKCGVRAKVREDGVLEEAELKRCIELVMGGGEEGAEMKKKARELSWLAKDAWKEGGSSEINLDRLLEKIVA
ncbi:hypothetical protein AMTRI_Chr02g213390 [Amborella trichopoda]